MLAIIPARAGSKGLRGKNILPLKGHPLLAWTIDAAFRADVFDRVVVSTDGEEIAAIAERYGASVVRRPENLAQDDSRPKDAVAHAYAELSATGYASQHFCLLQPTSPLRRPSDIQACVSMMNSGNFDSIASFTVASPHPMRAFSISDDLQAARVNDKLDIWGPRQAFIPQYHLNGAVYVVSIAKLLADTGSSFLPGRIGAHIMPYEYSVDIDTAVDFKIAEVLFDNRPPPPMRNVAPNA